MRPRRFHAMASSWSLRSAIGLPDAPWLFTAGALALTLPFGPASHATEPPLPSGAAPVAAAPTSSAAGAGTAVADGLGGSGQNGSVPGSSSGDLNSETPQELRNEEASLAKQLANPVASLISVPFQFNADQGIGPSEDIQRYNLNIQPVVPLRLSHNWNLISRTILPVVNLQGAAGAETGQLQFGDTLQSLFLSPARPGPRGVIWGVGPVALLATATGPLSGLQQWGLGPTGVALVQRGHWTMGALANHLWSIANNGPNANLNATFLQPFLSYTTSDAWTITLNTESTYDWEASRWAVPVNLVVSKVTKIGNQLLSLGAGVRYWADGPDSGPHGWGGRVVLTLLFPTSGR